MRPTVEYPGDWNIPPVVDALIQQMFAGYARVVLQREFSEGQSGTQVFLAVPYRGEQD